MWTITGLLLKIQWFTSTTLVSNYSHIILRLTGEIVPVYCGWILLKNGNKTTTKCDLMCPDGILTTVPPYQSHLAANPQL